MSSRVLALATAAVIAVGAFGIGYNLGSSSAKDYTLYTGDCFRAATEAASCTAADVTWGVSGDVSWVDANGVGKGGPNDPADPWPTCLPQNTEVKGMRFAGAWLPAGSGGLGATIVWVDCRGH